MNPNANVQAGRYRPTTRSMIALSTKATSSARVTFIRYVADVSGVLYFSEAEARAVLRSVVAWETSGPGSSSRDQLRPEDAFIWIRPWRRWSLSWPTPVGRITSQSSAPPHRCMRGAPASPGPDLDSSARDQAASVHEPSAGCSTTTAGAGWAIPCTTDQPPNGERLPSIVLRAAPGAPSKKAHNDCLVLLSASVYAPPAPLSVNRTEGEVVQVVRVRAALTPDDVSMTIQRREPTWTTCRRARYGPGPRRSRSITARRPSRP